MLCQHKATALSMVAENTYVLRCEHCHLSITYSPTLEENAQILYHVYQDLPPEAARAWGAVLMANGKMMGSVGHG